MPILLALLFVALGCSSSEGNPSEPVTTSDSNRMQTDATFRISSS